MKGIGIPTFVGIAGLVLTLGAVTPARAELITYTFSGTGSGSLGSQSFTDTLFTITSTADTSQVTNSSPGIFRVPDLTANVTVSGIGTGTFTITTINVSNQNVSRVGISDPNQNMAILFVDNPAVATYDLTTAIGPLTGPTAFNPGATFATTAGDFSLTVVPSATFQATVGQAIPEPATLTLIGIGALGLLGHAWRRKKS